MQESITVGNVEIIALIDMVPPPRQPKDFFPDVQSGLWEPYRNDVLESGMIQLYYGCFIVRSSGKIIMVDTGIGPGPHLTRGGMEGKLMGELRRVGIKPYEVDNVIHSHLHFDHVGWNIDWSGESPRPYFPNARYLVPSVDWDHFTDPKNLKNSPWIEESVTPLKSLSLMDLFEDGFHVTDEITALMTPGHTPGHMVFLINSQGKKGAILGDAIHSKVQIQEPSWCAGVDTDKEASESNRRKLIQNSYDQDYILAAGHFHPEEHFGRIVTKDDNFKWQGL